MKMIKTLLVSTILLFSASSFAGYVDTGTTVMVDGKEMKIAKFVPSARQKAGTAQVASSDYVRINVGSPRTPYKAHVPKYKIMP